MRLILIFLLMICSAGLVALECSVCGQTITGKYITAKNKSFCSEKCYEQTLPKCSLCGKPFREGVQIQDNPDKVYCKECAAKPSCFNCRLPNDCQKLEDGRGICFFCYEHAIFDPIEAKKVFDEVRRRLKAEMGLGTDRLIYFHLVSLPELVRRSADEGPPGQELGLYSYTFTEITRTPRFSWPWSKTKETVTRVQERFEIFALYGMTRDKLMEVCAHELAHDWMQKHYYIRDIKIREGWAEYTAYEANKLFGHKSLNLRMENNPDPNYGDGFRFIRDYVAEHGRDKLFEYFESLDVRKK